MDTKIGFYLKTCGTKTRKIENEHFSKSKVKTEVKEMVTCLEEKEIISSAPKPIEAPLVVPLPSSSKTGLHSLIHSHQSKLKRAAPSDTTDENAQDLTSRAVTALIAEASQFDQNKDEDGTTTTFSLPANGISANDAPEEEEISDADYSAVPLTSYGAALLRGMGWNGVLTKAPPTAAMAATEDPLAMPQLRPKGLGLGADRAAKSNNTVPSTISNSDPSNKSNEELTWKKGAFCLIVSGRRAGLYGTIESVDHVTERLAVRLAIGREVVEPLMANVRLVTEREFKEQGKYLNKKEADQVRQQQMEELRKESKRGATDKKDTVADDMVEQFEKLRQSQHKKPRDAPDDSTKQSDDNKSKHKTKKHSHESHSSSTSKSHKRADSWLMPNLRVRIIDKKFQQGRYYKQKVVVVDTPAPDLATCKTDEGRYLGEVVLSALETVIPHEGSTPVLIVRGRHRGTIAKIVEKNSKRSEVIVHPDDSDNLLHLGYDDVCEYVG